MGNIGRTCRPPENGVSLGSRNRELLQSDVANAPTSPPNIKPPFYKRQSCGIARCAGLGYYVWRERILFLNATAGRENREGDNRMTLLPSIFLSGYIFPVDNMPQIFQMLSKFIPATYMMEISRGVILRSAGLPELWLNALILFAMGVTMLLIAANRFRTMIV